MIVEEGGAIDDLNSSLTPLGILSHGVSQVFPYPTNRELKQASFLSFGRKPEVNISHARTMVSQIFKLIVSTGKNKT